MNCCLCKKPSKEKSCQDCKSKVMDCLNEASPEELSLLVEKLKELNNPPSQE